MSSINQAEEQDSLFVEAARLIINKNKAYIGMLQREFKIGFNRAAKIMDQLADAGIVGEEVGTKPREILISLEEFEDRLSRGEFDTQETDSPALGRQNPDENPTSRESIYDRLGKEASFKPGYAKTLLSSGNLLIPKADYDLPLDSVEKIVLSCPPDEGNFLILDNMGILNLYDGAPQFLLPVVSDTRKMGGALNWVVTELENRKKSFISAGARDFASYKTGEKPVLLIIIRELHDVIQEPSVYDALQTLLPICNRFGIAVIAFSMYNKAHLQLRELEVFFTEQTMTWFRSFMAEDHVEKQASSEQMDTMTGVEFEQYCAEVLKATGFTDISLTKTSGDFGGDILATKDQIKYVIQCKRYDSTIGVHAVQEVIASRSIYKAHVGVVMTNMYFSAPAKTLATENNILLWDRNDILRMAEDQPQ